MDKKTATKLMHKVEFINDGSDCWIPKYTTRSVRYGKEMISIAYLSYVLSNEKVGFRWHQRIARVCENGNCFNPEHMLFDEMDRFWFYTKIDKDSGCWNWIHSTDGGGYGVFVCEKYGRDKAHRISYIENYGEIPEGLWVLHRCDNPSCVRPDHLFLGTNDDNIEDKVSKNRQSRLFGEHNGRKILGEDDVKNMRKDYSSGKYSYRTLVEKYGISQTQVARIVKKESWAWL